MHTTILVLGNPLEDIDKLPIQLLPKLQQRFPTIDFVLFDPTEELPEPIPKHLYLLDTVVGISEMTIFNDMNDFLLSPQISAHDFDLPLFLGMLKKLGKINEVTIIGIPSNQTEEDVLSALVPMLFSLST
jgi:hypothetical protein